MTDALSVRDTSWRTDDAMTANASSALLGAGRSSSNFEHGVTNEHKLRPDRETFELGIAKRED